MADLESRDVNEHSLTEPLSGPEGRATPENAKRDAETVGEGSGGFLGAVTGMSLGIAGGPVGMVLGGLAGGLGGWWAGHEIAEALTEDDDAAFRTHYEAAPDRLADRGYEHVRPAYVTGHLAGRNPDYAGRSFDDVEPDLRRGWSDDVARQTTDWASARNYARAAFDRSRAGRPAR